MATNNAKKRKVENTNSPPQALSAFAALAARNRQTQQDLNLVSSKQEIVSRNDPSNTTKKTKSVDESKVLKNELPVSIPAKIFQLSTIHPSQIKKGNNTDVKILLKPGDRLVVIGQYDLLVTKGCVKIFGASLFASSTKHHVSAPSSHCLPVIRCDGMEIEAAELRLSQSSNGLEQLSQVSPLFARIWNDSMNFLDTEGGDTVSGAEQRSLDLGSFRILYSIFDASSKNSIRPMISPPEWNALLSNLQSPNSQRPLVVLVCGPKSAGKSKFSKLLINRIITSREASKSASLKSNENATLVLDCDPGQPEFSTPGHLSLILLKGPNFSPPFSHPRTSGTGSRLIRAHSIAAITPSNDPEYYMSCIKDLLRHYRERYSCYPLVINTPGWILGTGLEILVDLIQLLTPTAVVYMSQEGPVEVVESLKEGAKSIPLYTLPSQGSDSAARNSSSLRAMQTMSYFHLKDSSTNLSWDPTPLSSLPPLQIRYSGDSPGIMGILFLADQPSPQLIAEAINGSVLDIVVVEDIGAFPGLEDSDEKDILESIKTRVRRTPKEGIPYFVESGAEPNPGKLNPKYCRTIGSLLIRGIDVQNHRLQVLTPIAPKVFEDVLQSRADYGIILVSGKLDNPGWAYTEELHRQAWAEKKSAGKEDSESEDMGVDTGGFENIPWVEKLVDGKGRGEGGRVWKVRRDLGKKGA